MEITCNRRQSPFIFILRRHSPFYHSTRLLVNELHSKCLVRLEKIMNVFGATSTTDEVLSGVNLQGKRILVTGVSAGIGLETAQSLAAHGAHVVGAARDLAKAQTATARVRQDAAAGGGSFEMIELD